MIEVQVTEHSAGGLLRPSELVQLVRAVCERFGVRQATVSVGIVDDSEITELNRRFLDHEGTTDCLSFDLSDEADRAGQRVFDLIVNDALAAREAARRGHTGRAELALYVTHALLHNLGFDDATAEGADEMHRAEDEILKDLGYGLVYNTDTRRPPSS
jgi:probable rRNA maturation factor